MRVTSVNKAQSDVGKCCRAGCTTEIKIGDSYRWFKFRNGPKRVFCSAHRPKSSEMTQSDKLSTLYAAREHAEELLATEDIGREDISAELNDCAQAARDVGEEYQSSLDNMPEQLQESSGIQEKIDACEQWADELESAASEVESMEDWTEMAQPDEPDENASEEDKKAYEEATELIDQAKQEAIDYAQNALDSLEI